MTHKTANRIQCATYLLPEQRDKFRKYCDTRGETVASFLRRYICSLLDEGEKRTLIEE